MKTVIRPETEMKDSGIEWIGDIPSSWTIFPANGVFSEAKEKNTDLKFTNAFSFKYGEIVDKKQVGDVDNNLKETLSSYTIVRKNTIMINGLNLNYDFVSQRVAIVNESGVITSAYLAIQPDENKINPRFVLYLLKSYDYQQVFHGLGSGIRKTLKYQDFKKIMIVAPTLSEQQVIADYLDKTCSQIDEIIAEAKASIDEYKELKQSVIFEAVTKGLDKNVEMKDSGVEWIGEIPVDWNIAKINRVAWTTSGATPLRSKETEYYDNAVIRWARTLDLNNGHVTDSSEKITETALKNSSCSIMPVKTVCVAMYGGSGTIGKSGILEVECATNQAICSIVSDKKVLNPDYLHYVIMAVRKYWMKYAVGTRKDPNINQQIIAQMRIPIPQLSKQDIIVNHLDKVTDKCDSLISEKESLINDLEAYKKSLIYEVVTGKRRVV